MQQPASIHTLKDCVRVSEAAEMLGVTTKTLRNWDRSGKVKAMRHPVNGYRLYPRKQLEHLLSQTAEDSVRARS